jgi:hypothetical protein
MALSVNLPLVQNPAWHAQYARIDAVHYHRTERVIEVIVGFYADEIAAAERPPITTKVHRWHGDEADLILAALHDTAGGQVYDLLRALPEYEDAPNA